MVSFVFEPGKCNELGEYKKKKLAFGRDKPMNYYEILVTSPKSRALGFGFLVFRAVLG